MRHFSIFGGALAIASLSFMFSSCSKQLDQPADPDRQEITAKTTHECKNAPESISISYQRVFRLIL